jgi:hypothetical protein
MAFDYRSGIEDVNVREMPDVVISPSQIPLPVTPVPSTTYTNKIVFNSIQSVSSGIETDIVTYTVPVGKTALLAMSEGSGTNMASFTAYVNNVAVSKQRTYYTFFNYTMGFSSLYLVAGDVVTIKVIHNRPTSGDFDANIMVMEKN